MECRNHFISYTWCCVAVPLTQLVARGLSLKLIPAGGQRPLKIAVKGRKPLQEGARVNDRHNATTQHDFCHWSRNVTLGRLPEPKLTHRFY